MTQSCIDRHMREVKESNALQSPELLGVHVRDTGRGSCKAFLRGSEPWGSQFMVGQS